MVGRRPKEYKQEICLECGVDDSINEEKENRKQAVSQPTAALERFCLVISVMLSSVEHLSG